MKKFEVAIKIHAPAERIWEILTDVANWPQWDPFCEKITGEVALGAKMSVLTKLAPGRAFALKVTELEPRRKMTWTGGMPLGLFKGERTFVLEPQSDGSIEFRMQEVFIGPLSGLIGKTMPDLTPAFIKHAEGLKARSESRL